MRHNKILFVDTETGGLNPELHSLLSIGFAVWDKGEIVRQKELFINDGDLNVTQEAININKIDISYHSLIGIAPLQALIEIEDFLDLSFGINEKIILCGHNIFFDVGFLKRFWSNQSKNFSQRFSHRYVDTASILYYLYATEKIPFEAISSQGAFDHFKIYVNKRHSALSDALATAELFNKLLQIER
jgi:DNA polymerase III subunit epsilon